MDGWKRFLTKQPLVNCTNDATRMQTVVGRALSSSTSRATSLGHRTEQLPNTSIIASQSSLSESLQPSESSKVSAIYASVAHMYSNGMVTGYKQSLSIACGLGEVVKTKELLFCSISNSFVDAVS
jgi:hypothetical protein